MASDRTNSYFYTASGGALYQKNKVNGNVVSLFPANFTLGTVHSLQFDGVYYWTLERQTSGVLIRKWEIVSGILVQRSIFSYVSDAMIDYDAYSFSVDYVNTTLSAVAYIGSSTVPVIDSSIFNVGDEVVLGPSTYSGYTDKKHIGTIVSKDATNIYLDVPLSYTFNVGNGVYCSRYFYLFNKYAPFTTSMGSLLRFNASSGVLTSFSSGTIFSDVKASCFYNDKILFVKGNELIYLSNGTMFLYRHMAIDNLGSDRATTLNTYAIVAHSDVLYSLRDRYVFYDSGVDEWDEEVWSSQYNYVSSSLLSQVYFIEVKATPDIIHVVSPPGVPTSTSDITIHVLDQYRVPLSGKTVNLSTDEGTVVPITGVTDSNGEITAVYNGTTTEKMVEITATVV